MSNSLAAGHATEGGKACQEIAERGSVSTVRGHCYGVINVLGTNSRVQLGDTLYEGSGTAFGDNGTASGNRELLSSLEFPEIQARFESLEQNYTDTYEWIWQPPNLIKPPWDSFVDWLNGEQKQYWISGKLGSGKSTLMKYLIESLIPRQNEAAYVTKGRCCTEETIVLSFFFWEAGSEMERSVAGCIRSLLWQLVRTRPRQKVIDLQAERNWTVLKLCKAFRHAIQCCETPLIIFLDGLDECCEVDVVLDLLSFLRQLDDVKICVFSRREESFVTALQSWPQLRLQDLNQTDIELVLQQELLENFRVKPLVDRDPSTVEHVIRKVREKAEGVFLWVRLVIKSLLRGIRHRDSLEVLLQRIEQFPNDIEQLYTYMWKRHGPDRDLYAKDGAFFCHLVALGVDSLFEFCFATDERLRRKYLEETTVLTATPEQIDRDVDAEFTSSRINVCSAGFLEVVSASKCFPNLDVEQCGQGPSMGPFPGKRANEAAKKRVQFIHRSAYQYVFQTLDGQRFLAASTLSELDLERIRFESALVCRLLFPALLLEGYIESRVASVIEDCFSKTPRNQHFSWLHELEEICILLSRRGLVLVEDSSLRIISSRWVPFFSSRYKPIDFGPLYVRMNYHHLLKQHVEQYCCSGDKEYLSYLLIYASDFGAMRLINDATGVELRPSREAADILKQSGACVNALIRTGSGDETIPIVWFANSDIDIRYAMYDANQDLGNASLPLCCGCYNIWCVQSSGNHENKDYLELWGNFTAHDLLLLKNKDDSSNLRGSQVYIIARSSRAINGPPVLLAVDESDSSPILECFHHTKQPPRLNSSQTEVGILRFTGLPVANSYGGEYLKQEGLAPFYEIERRCRRLTTMAEALQYMGKSEATIWASAKSYTRWLESIYIESSTSTTMVRKYTPTEIRAFEDWVWGPQPNIEGSQLPQAADEMSPACPQQDPCPTNSENPGGSFHARKRKRADTM